MRSSTDGKDDLKNNPLVEPYRTIQLSFFVDEGDLEEASPTSVVRENSPAYSTSHKFRHLLSKHLEAAAAWVSFEEELRNRTKRLPLIFRPISRLIENMLKRIVVITALGNHALLPYTEVLEACGISRDVGEELREKGKLEPLIVKNSENPRLYITVGAWSEFVRKCRLAPPPSKSKLSKAIRRKQYE